MAASTNNARSAAPRQQTPFDLPGYTLPLNYKPSVRTSYIYQVISAKRCPAEWPP